MAFHASAFNGMTRSPASVLLLRTASVLSMRSMSRQRSCLISQPRIVVFRAVLRLLYTIAAVPKPGGSILYGDGLEGFGDGLFQDLGSASFGGAEQLLQLRPGLLDRIEIG